MAQAVTKDFGKMAHRYRCATRRLADERRWRKRLARRRRRLAGREQARLLADIERDYRRATGWDVS